MQYAGIESSITAVRCAGKENTQVATNLYKIPSLILAGLNVSGLAFGIWQGDVHILHGREQHAFECRIERLVASARRRGPKRYRCCCILSATPRRCTAVVGTIYVLARWNRRCSSTVVRAHAGIDRLQCSQCIDIGKRGARQVPQATTPENCGLQARETAAWKWGCS